MLYGAIKSPAQTQRGLVLGVGVPLALFRQVRLTYVLFALVLIGIGGSVILDLATVIWEFIDAFRQRRKK